MKKCAYTTAKQTPQPNKTTVPRKNLQEIQLDKNPYNELREKKPAKQQLYQA